MMGGQKQQFASAISAPADVPISLTDRSKSTQVHPSLFSPRTFQHLVTLAEVGADFLTCVVGVFVAYNIYYVLNVGRHVYYPTRDLVFISVMVGLVVVLLFERDSAYRGSTSLLKIRETERSLRIPCLALVLLAPPSLLFGQSFSRGVLLYLILVLPILLIIQKYLLFSFVQTLHAKGYGVKKVLIYGAGYTGRRIFTALINSPKLGFAPIGITDDDPNLDRSEIHELGYKRKHSATVSRIEITAEYLRSTGCDTLFIAIPSASRRAIFSAIQAAEEANVYTAFLPDHRHLNALSAEPVDLDGIFLTFSGDRVPSWYYRAIKRAFDYLVSLVLFILVSPLMLIVALMIRLESPGPALFRQERVGLNGVKFTIFKFRTMQTDSPKYARSPILSSDKRITRIGRYLRRTSLDELPQILNVLRGEMSLVGPRPEMPFLVEKYGPVQRQRLQVIPGITGLWQLSADRAFLIHDTPEYDMYYIRNCGFFLDVAILLHTILFAMRGV